MVAAGVANRQGTEWEAEVQAVSSQNADYGSGLHQQTASRLQCGI